MYQREVDADMLNTVNSLLADVSSVNPRQKPTLCSDEGLLNARNVSQQTPYGVQHIHINLTLIHSTFYRYADAD